MPASARSPRADAGVVELARILRRAGQLHARAALGPSTAAFGAEAPQFHLRVTGEHLLCGPLTELTLGRGYVQGDLDIAVEGAIDGPAYPANAMAAFDVRDEIRFGVSPRQALRLAAELAADRSHPRERAGGPPPLQPRRRLLPHLPRPRLPLLLPVRVRARRRHARGRRGAQARVDAERARPAAGHAHPRHRRRLGRPGRVREQAGAST